MKKESAPNFIDNTWGTDLPSMQLIRNAWVIPLKDKKGITIGNTFPKSSQESNLTKHW